jgi:hypothetical protein
VKKRLTESLGGVEQINEQVQIRWYANRRVANFLLMLQWCNKSTAGDAEKAHNKTQIRLSSASSIARLNVWDTVSNAREDAKSAWGWRFRTKFIGMGYYFL